MQYGEEAIQDQLRDEMIQFFQQKEQKYWLDLLKEEDTCVGPVYDLDEVFTDPQVLAREMLLKTEDRLSPQIGFPIKFSATPGEVRTYAPDLGEHTRQILSELHYTEEDIDQMQAQKVIGS
jgi:crotonobetainyl-CoA:carnitine CoA-transferase CaiB-like acyl-CoA transferase